MHTAETHSIRRFSRHYAEIVVAMFLGMFALSKPADWLFGASTSS
jgi:hypothetical protein